jgi:hypothetical protein
VNVSAHVIPPWAKALAALLFMAALVGAGAWGGSRVTAGGYEARIAKMETDKAAAILKHQERADEAAARYEEWKAARAPRVAEAKRGFDHAVQAAPDWNRTAVPDGMRNAIDAAIAAATGSGEPAPAVPAVGASAAQDERGTGEGLRLGSRLGFGLPQAPP